MDGGELVSGSPPSAEVIEAVPLKHPGRWISAVVVLVLAAMVAHTAWTNPNLHWSVVGNYLTDSYILGGLRNTIILTFLAMAIGIAGGIALAIARLTPNPIVSGGAWLYIWFFRGTPVLIQLVFWYNLAILSPRLGIGIPFGTTFFSGSTNDIITKFGAALLGLGLNEAAYMAEIVRAGILSVDQGQTDAAHALGMTRGLVMRRIVLPQAMRVIIPPTGNETISMLKTTSLVFAISYPELFDRAEIIAGRTFEVIAMLLVVSIWYLVATSVLTFGQYYVERYFARGVAGGLPDTPLQRLRQNLVQLRPRQ